MNKWIALSLVSVGALGVICCLFGIVFKGELIAIFYLIVSAAAIIAGLKHLC